MPGQGQGLFHEIQSSGGIVRAFDSELDAETLAEFVNGVRLVYPMENEAMRFFKIPIGDIVVFHDELDLAPPPRLTALAGRLRDFDGIDDTTRRRLSGIATHNDVLLFLVHDPLGWGVHSDERAVVGDGAMQAEIDFGSSTTRDAA